MSTLRQAAQALGDRISDLGASPLDWPEYTALLSALAEPEQEPVAWGMPREDGLVLDVICQDERDSYRGAYTIPLYAAPVATPDIAKLTAERDALKDAARLALDALLPFGGHGLIMVNQAITALQEAL